MKEEVLLRKEITGIKVSLLKTVAGAVIGAIFGLAGLHGGLWLLLGVALVVPLSLAMKFIFAEMADVHPAKLIFLYGSLAYVVALMLFWTLVFNLLSPIKA